MMLEDRKYRKKKLKEIDPDEYEDEIWLAYVEPQYENEYSRMLATMKTQGNPNYKRSVNTKEELENCINESREKVKNIMKMFNPNVEVPEPKLVEINKISIKL